LQLISWLRKCELTGDRQWRLPHIAGKRNSPAIAAISAPLLITISECGVQFSAEAIDDSNGHHRDASSYFSAVDWERTVI
jgi:hypothetical protein